MSIASSSAQAIPVPPPTGRRPRDGHAATMPVHQGEALAAIEALGSVARQNTPLGVLGPFGQWLGWPDWMRNGTTLRGRGPLPQFIPLSDDLIMTANLLDHGHGDHLIARTLRSRRLITGPSTALIIRNAPTLGDALAAVCAMITATNPTLDMTHAIEHDRYVVRLERRVPLRRLWGFLCLVRTILVLRAIESFQAPDARRMTVRLSFPEGAAAGSMREMLCPNMAYGQDSDAISFPLAWVDAPNAVHDPGLWRLALERARNAGQPAQAQSVVRRVRERVAHMLSDQGGVARLKQIAQEEGVSDRTIVRQLGALGTSFHEIVEQQRRMRVAELIADRSLSLSEVAEAAGFSDASSFGRSFRRWFGDTPAQFRANAMDVD